MTTSPREVSDTPASLQSSANRHADVSDPLGNLRHPECDAIEEPQGRHRLAEARPCHAPRREVDVISADVIQQQLLRGDRRKNRLNFDTAWT
jgi:hypothetical protein